jgi:hypothetical protein
MKKMYSQCRLQKHIDNKSYAEQVSYIPAEFATVGNVLKLKEDEVWEDGWKVIHASEPTDYAPDYRKAIRNHRDNTGDATPKN